MEFVYWRHPSVPGIKVEEVTGGEHYKGKIWREMALQLYCENGKNEFREIGHYQNGAPFLFGENSRISISHCDGLLVVATLPPTPDINLGEFQPAAGMGVDAERQDREQVLKIRERFLNRNECEMIPSDNVSLNVQAWTVKEAAYKASFIAGLDFREDIIIKRLGLLAPPTPVFDPEEFGLNKETKHLPEEFFGEVTVVCKDGTQIDLRCYSWISDECIVSLSYTPECIRFGK